MINNENDRVVDYYHNTTGASEQKGRSFRPEIDIGACNGCGGCEELAPEVFRYNDAFGFYEVIEHDYYDPQSVLEAVKNCPKKAISLVEEEKR